MQSPRILCLRLSPRSACARRRRPLVRTNDEGADRHGRRRADVSVQEHHPERGQLEGPHHAGRRREGRRPGRHAAGPGPFTVFAPTNAAFAKLPKGTVETLLKPENKEKLVAVLTYHVVPGRLSAKDLMELPRRTAAAPSSRPSRAKSSGRGKGQHAHDLGRQGRRRQGDDPERVPVERRDPRDRHRAAAEG